MTTTTAWTEETQADWLRSSFAALQSDLKKVSPSVSAEDTESLALFAREVEHYQTYGLTAAQIKKRLLEERASCLSSSPYLQLFKLIGRSSEYLKHLEKQEKAKFDRTKSLSRAELAEIINRLYPVVGYEVYTGNVLKPVRAFGLTKRPELELEFDEDGVLIEPEKDAEKGRIKHLSSKSRSRLAFHLNACGVDWKSMLTVTYGELFPQDGREVAKDRNAILTALQKRFPNCLYFWFTEFQRRGAPHIHILLDFEPTKADRQWWSRYWSRRQQKRYGLNALQVQDVVKFNSHLRAWENAKSKDGLRRYGVKYATKTHQKNVPLDYQNVGRFWGHSRELKPQKIGEVVCSEDELRDVLKSYRPKVASWDILPTYIFGFNLMEEGESPND